MTFLNPRGSLAIMVIALSLIGCVRDAAERPSTERDRESCALPPTSPQQACEYNELTFDANCTEEDDGWEGLEPRITCNRDELSYVDEDAAE